MARKQLGAAASDPTHAATRADVLAATDARIKMLEANIGDGTVGPFTVTHGFGTRTVIVEVWKNRGGTSATGALQGQRVQVDVQLDPTNDRNAVLIKPDEAIGANEYHVLVIGVVGSSDVTAPTRPTLTASNIGANGFRVTPSGATDAVGVAGYSYFLNGNYVTTVAGAYDFTGLSPATQYTVTATAIDIAGNESPLSIAITPTTTGVPVAFATSSGVGTATASQANGSISQTVNVTKAGQIILAWYATTHVNGINPTTGFSSLACTSSVSGTTFTKLASVSTSGNTGTLHLFAVINPPIGSHNVTRTSNSGGTWMDGVRGAVEVYDNVSAINVSATRTGQGSAAVAAAVAAALGNMAVLGIVHDSGLTALSGTVRDTGGAGINGSGDFLSVTDAPGEADGTVDFTSSNAVTHGFISVELVRAA